MNIFDYYKHIIKDETPIDMDQINKDFDTRSMTRLFSYDPLNIFLAEELNLFYRLNLPKEIGYMYWFNVVDKRTRVPFLDMRNELKPSKNDDVIISYIQEIFHPLSRTKAINIFNTFPNVVKKITELIDNESILKDSGKTKSRRKLQ